MNKLSKPVGKLLASGLTGSGKSTLLQLVFEYLMQTISTKKGSFVWKDTSALLETSKLRRTKAGLQLLGMNGEQGAGKVLDAGPVIGSLIENIAWLLQQHPQLEGVGIAGSTRNGMESQYWLGHANVRQILIEATPAQVRVAINRRIANDIALGKPIRPDDGPRTLATKLNEYETKILPAVGVFPEHLVLRLHRDMPLLERIKLTLRHMYSDNPNETIVSKQVFEAMMEQLSYLRHPIHIAIKEVEAGKPIPAIADVLQASTPDRPLKFAPPARQYAFA